MFTLESDANTTFFVKGCIYMIRTHQGEGWILEQGLRGVVGKLFSRLNHYVDMEYEVGISVRVRVD